MEKIKWGIMGPGNISSKFASDLVQSDQAELVAVASRTQGKAEKFASEFNIPRTYNSYEEFVKDDEIEIVYIGTLHPMHKEGVLQCLKAGKAVLCEKPFTMNAQEAEELIQVARENDTFLMEAMWTRYLPAIVQTRKWIAEGKIGEIKMLTANFGFDIGWAPESRLLDKKLGGGALLDAGIYPVSFASMIFGQQPTSIKSSAHIGQTGVDEQFSALFEYENGRTAMLNASVRLNLSNDAFIYGTEGYIHLPNFLFGESTKLYRSGSEAIEFKDDRTMNGYIFEAEEAMSCLRAEDKESRIMPLDETQDIMETLDTLRKQWGLEYE
ncbi:Gfo/Idh/MocA family protein [Lederbergia lenta]|uniref:Oxidoreductase domain-containing protein n=1 Tax=Lederbergia lenta TaxID=1467 RepID=A0A2X4VS27_LEDLE|nr:Gfo/Idh/MocA family oxidoreductase [Lederbergia lenta]MCM3112380.1 Gfo/Idh/MocA family oxidoreductase [Lederbergia lenta]MEC2326599.1 Gfo/Idh/MocA family oxidoreductase [Lederbergia lenta]SQI53059.1 oxidoreductase domain-containing protein [Lederbergia lenta]